MNSDFAFVDDAVVIDLSDMNTVSVDVQSKVGFTLESFFDTSSLPLSANTSVL